jgi:hypothetical protein
MQYFCTYFDQHYLLRGLALYQSLSRHCPAFRLFILCLDEASHRILSQLNLPDVRLVVLEDLEKGDEELLSAKQDRSRIEYFFTCTPSLLLWLLNNSPDVDRITYLDADLYFFANPAPVFDEIGDSSIAIIEHRFPGNLRNLERFGVYNVGWLSFRRDQHGLACLQWWRERCIEWCYDRCEDGRFADQKYLDDWPDRFQDGVVLRHKGANLAPWNLANYRIRADAAGVWVDDDPLIFFHFHGLKQIWNWLYDPSFATYKVKTSSVVSREIYGPYIRSLLDTAQQVSPLWQQVHLHRGIRDQLRASPAPQRLSPLRRMVRGFRRGVNICRRIFAREYFLVRHGRVV